MLFRQLFDRESSTYSYLIADTLTREAILVDSVIDQIDRDLQLIRELDLTLKYCLETHIHADHITGAGELRDRTNCLGIVPINAEAKCADRFIKHDEEIKLGQVEIKAIATLGHTDSHMAYLINGKRVLTGDALLIRGCGRTDFQNGNAGTLYDSVTSNLFSLPDETLVYPAHDYHGRTVSTIGEEKQWNPRFRNNNRQDFIKLMDNLDLSYPRKMMEAVPANQGCGKVNSIASTASLK